MTKPDMRRCLVEMSPSELLALERDAARWRWVRENTYMNIKEDNTYCWAFRTGWPDAATLMGSANKVLDAVVDGEIAKAVAE